MSRYNVNVLPAVFTPMNADESVNYDQIDALYQHCIATGYRGIFLNGTTGECMSLDSGERKKILETWTACRKKANHPDFKIFAHIGSSNLLEAADLAAHAQAQGADGIAMVPTFYFRPRTLPELIEQCKYVAGAAPDTPFYYYNIPSLTGVSFPLAAFVDAATRAIPTFSGLKNSFNDLVDYQKCIHFAKDDYTLYWGTDELFMMVYTGGNRNYVGSTYNFMGDLYFKMLDAYHAGDFAKVTALEAEATDIYNILGGYSNAMVAGKAVMKFLGIDCGPVRRPLKNMTASETDNLLERLQKTSFFEYTGVEKVLNTEK